MNIWWLGSVALQKRNGSVCALMESSVSAWARSWCWVTLQTSAQEALSTLVRMSKKASTFARVWYSRKQLGQEVSSKSWRADARNPCLLNMCALSPAFDAWIVWQCMHPNTVGGSSWEPADVGRSVIQPYWCKSSATLRWSWTAVASFSRWGQAWAKLFLMSFFQ